VTERDHTWPVTEFVEPQLRRNRGYPWPESSYGLDPMFGVEGWCHGCGVPFREQSGPVVLQTRTIKSTKGAFMPGWRFDVLCVADEALEQWDGAPLELRPVSWHTQSRGSVSQIVPHVSAKPWFDPDSLAAAIGGLRPNEEAGTRCASCERWKWTPLSAADCPELRLTRADADYPLNASPEYFGSGLQGFRQVVVSRELGTFLQRQSPRDFTLAELPQVRVGR
jgi:hypothetical protein